MGCGCVTGSERWPSMSACVSSSVNNSRAIALPYLPMKASAYGQLLHRCAKALQHIPKQLPGQGGTLGSARRGRRWTAPSHANHPPHAGDTGGVGARIGRRRRQLTTMTARRLRLLKQLARITQQISEAENLTGEAQTMTFYYRPRSNWPSCDECWRDVEQKLRRSGATTDLAPGQQSPGRLVDKPNNLTGHQASIVLVLVSAPPALMATFTASSIGSLKGTSIRSRPCS